MNESIFREVNERIQELGESSDQRQLEFVCECQDLECAERIELALDEYEAIRAQPTHFLVVPGHEQPDVDRVVREGDGYLVVEKVGEAGELAESDDPRAE